MIKELDILIRLQEIDNQLMEIEDEMGDLPAQIDSLTTRLEDLMAKTDEQQQMHDQLVNERKQVRSMMDHANERLRRGQSVILAVKTTREYDAVTTEIEKAKLDISEGDKRELTLTSQINALHNEIDQGLEVIDEIETELKAKKAEMEERLSESRDEQGSLVSDRAKLAEQLPKPVIAHYERIRKIRDGIGVTQLSGDACGYCFSVLPPQRQAEIKKMEDMILCEVCGCVIVSESDSPNLTDAF